jgi:hypothetical protein
MSEKDSYTVMEEVLKEATRILSKEAGYLEQGATRPRDNEAKAPADRVARMLAYAKHLRNLVEGLRELHPAVLLAEGWLDGLKCAARILDGETEVEPAHKAYHYFLKAGRCDCTFDRECIHDRECDEFAENNSLYFKDLYGMTEEEYSEHLRQEREQRIRASEEAAQAHARQREMSLRELAAEQGIDPKLLP